MTYRDYVVSGETPPVDFLRSERRTMAEWRRKRKEYVLRVQRYRQLAALLAEPESRALADVLRYYLVAGSDRKFQDTSRKIQAERQTIVSQLQLLRKSPELQRQIAVCNSFARSENPVASSRVAYAAALHKLEKLQSQVSQRDDPGIEARLRSKLAELTDQSAVLNEVMLQPDSLDLGDPVKSAPIPAYDWSAAAEEFRHFLRD